jgi:hypothetical protein
VTQPTVHKIVVRFCSGGYGAHTTSFLFFPLPQSFVFPLSPSSANRLSRGARFAASFCLNGLGMFPLVQSSLANHMNMELTRFVHNR